MYTTVIGLCGEAGSGKSSVAQYLIDRYGAVRYSLAAPLKEMVKAALDLTDEQVYGTQAQKEAPDPRYGGKSARWFLQRIGTEGVRNTWGADFWIKLTLGEGGRIWRDAPALAVVDDVRFENEAAAIREWKFGRVWRLDCPQRESSADAGHASEAGVRDISPDYIIAPAKRGLDDLYRLVDDAARHYQLFPKRPELPL